MLAETLVDTWPTGSMFTGIGGLDLGLERAGARIIWQAEIDPYASRVLARHWPDVPNLGDVTVVDWSTVERPRLLCGGFPCQPVSDRGLRLAQADPRWLWPEMFRAVTALRPHWLLVENVPGLRRRGLDIVRRDLDSLGYRTRPIQLSACELGAPHARRRLFTVAHASGVRCGAGGADGRGEGASAGEHEDGPAADGNGWWTDEPGVGRVAYGLPDRVDRIRGLGNAVVPQVAEWIGRRIIGGDGVTTDNDGAPSESGGSQ